MTREEAQKELSELEATEREAWEAYQAREMRRNKEYASLKTELEKVYPEAEQELKKLEQAWSPLYRRKQKLVAFLEVA